MADTSMHGSPSRLLKTYLGGFIPNCDRKEYHFNYHPSGKLGGDMGRRASHQLPQTAYGTDCSPDPAIQFTLSCLNKTVLFMIDNTTAVAYLSRQARRDTVLLPPQTAHIAGETNVLVDMASRVGPTILTEWTLTTRGYQWICSRSRWATPSL